MKMNDIPKIKAGNEIPVVLDLCDGGVPVDFTTAEDVRWSVRNERMGCQGMRLKVVELGSPVQLRVLTSETDALGVYYIGVQYTHVGQRRSVDVRAFELVAHTPTEACSDPESPVRLCAVTLIADVQGIPPGGEAGQVLTKTSDADYAANWKTVDIPTKVSELQNDAGYATEQWVNDAGYATEQWVNDAGYATEQWTADNYVSKEDADEVLPYMEDLLSYGIERRYNVSATGCTRVGNPALHRTLPIQNKMRGCLLDDDGNVVEYLPENDWTGSVRDGSRGQVMVEIPAHYRKCYSDDVRWGVRISEVAIPGYMYIPKSYMSAYEASIQRSTGKLCSVVNDSPDYRGGNNQSAWDGTYRSLLGRPTTKINRTEFRNAARLRNSNKTAEWNMQVYTPYVNVCWLYYVEYANTNCQLAYNAQKDANGYAQGGLGNGVTTMGSTEWNKFNTYNPFVPCGHTDILGNGSGEIAYDIMNSDGSTLSTVMVPRYRGIENPFGHIWKYLDGINVKIQSNAAGGRSEVYVCTDPAKYNDSNYDGYGMRGLGARSTGYIIDIIFGEYGDIVSSEVGGSSNTYWADYFYPNIPESGEALRCINIGGDAYGSVRAGIVCLYVHMRPSNSNTNVGSRLCFIPKNN